MGQTYKSIVNKIIYDKSVSIVGVTTGIKKDEQIEYDKKYKGGYGTYCTQFQNYTSELNAKIYVCKLQKYVYLDIKEAVLDINSRVRITNKMVDRLNELNSGKRIFFEFDDEDIIDNMFNKEKLDIKL